MNKVTALDTQWNLSCKAKGISLQTDIPSTVYEALLANNHIQDPFYGTNEQKATWVYKEDWVYEKELILTEEDLQADELILRFYGLDTIGTVSLNGNLLGSIDNMHRTWEFNLIGDFKKILTLGNNTLTVYFKSPVFHGEEETRKHKRNLREFPWFMKSPTLKGISYLRKALYSFGWDWGPQLPDSGIWRPVELERVQKAKICEINSMQSHIYTPTENRENPYLHKPIHECTLNVSAPWKAFGKNIEKPSLETRFTLEGPNYHKVETSKEGKTSFFIKNPELWWTYDLGEPTLYTLRVELFDGETLLDTKEQQIGLRDIRLIRNKDTWGETFYFQLNGVPLFAKGANWIPEDSFIPRGKKLGLYAKRIDDVKDAHMNMIRIWGGGIYEDDHFYDLCDQKGILVWQDFMFACFMPPKHEEFIESVRKEAIDNIKRLRHHPSIAIWVGNNEIEGGWTSLGYGIRFRNYKKNYLRLFESLLPKLVQEHDPQRYYWPSSPSSHGGFKKPESPNYGDSHFWDVWHGGKPFSIYREHYSRFMSEFGFESFPVMKTIAEFSEEKDWEFQSEVMENHQKNGAGNKKILSYMENRFAIPDDFPSRVTLSQITQAEAMEYGIDHWRRNRKDFRCMGALYWQLNDCWPVASWSSIDYYGRWKALHYFARRFFAPLYASVAEHKESFEIWGVNDTREEKEITLDWWHYSPKGTLLGSKSKEYTLAPANSALLETVETPQGTERGVVFYTISDETDVIYEGFKILETPSTYTWEDPELSWNLQKWGEGQYGLEITAKKPAIYIHWESNSDAKGVENFFSLMPGESKIVEITLPEGESPKEFKETLRVASLYNLYTQRG